MDELPRFTWDKPPKFTCDGCGAVVDGHLTSGGYFGEGTGPVLPAGWIRGWDRIAKKVHYACSGACGNAVMMGPRGGGTTP